MKFVTICNEDPPPIYMEGEGSLIILMVGLTILLYQINTHDWGIMTSCTLVTTISTEWGPQTWRNQISMPIRINTSSTHGTSFRVRRRSGMHFTLPPSRQDYTYTFGGKDA